MASLVWPWVPSTPSQEGAGGALGAPVALRVLVSEDFHRPVPGPVLSW